MLQFGGDGGEGVSYWTVHVATLTLCKIEQCCGNTTCTYRVVVKRNTYFYRGCVQQGYVQQYTEEKRRVQKARYIKSAACTSMHSSDNI